MIEEFNEDEVLEGQLSDISFGRKRLDELNATQRRRLVEYARKKTAHRKQQREQYEAEYAAGWARMGPQLRVLRHRKLEPEQFAPGTAVADALAYVSQTRGPSEELQGRCGELRARIVEAERVIEHFDVATADSPEALVRARLDLDFCRKKLRPLSTQAQAAHELHVYAEQSLHLAYAAYSAAVDELNDIADLRRPLGTVALIGRRETVEDRAKEVGEVSRLEYLIHAMTTPAAAPRATRSAA